MRKTFIISTVVLCITSACVPAKSIPYLPTATATSWNTSPVNVTEPPYPEVTLLPTDRGDEDECDNPFYPVSDEAVWMYSHSDGTNSTSTMSADDFGKFTIIAEGAGSTFRIDGECTPEGIVLMSSPGAATTYSGEYGNSTVSMMDVSGVTLPNDVGQGEQWTQTITVTTEAGKSEIETNYTAVGFENISVPAGDFYALKVEQSGYVTVFNQKVAMQGVQWFAEGVGVVKSAMDGAPVVELPSYDIPESHVPACMTI